MSVEVPTDTSEILEPESVAPIVISSTAKTFWSVATDHASAAKLDSSVSKMKKTGKGRPANSTDYVLMVAISVLIVAILVFYIMGEI